jgi:murein DD-endopeptidase MepM/ murein hydrolase activator NlpD
MAHAIKQCFALILIASWASTAQANAELAAAGKCRPDPNGPLVEQAVFPESKTSAYILPFEAGTARLVWRTTSHFTSGNGGVGLYAIDFKMPIGTPLLAARAGTVVAIQDRFPDGNNKDLEENFVMVRHDDGTIARYIHLKKGSVLVAMGEEVRQGQRIALSGNTGQTGGPHLHFDVQQCGPNLPPKYNALPCGMTVPITFRNGGENVCGLRAGQRVGGKVESSNGERSGR